VVVSSRRSAVVGRPDGAYRAGHAGLDLRLLDASSRNPVRLMHRRAAHQMPAEFAIAQHPIDSERLVVAVRGDLDLFTAPELKKVFAQAIGAGRIRIIVDLAETTFLDSSALGVLVVTSKRLRSCHGALAIVNLNENLTTIFKMTGLDQTFTILPTRESAIEAVASPNAA
jgi:anti-sigma B factor antagonist